ncbi:tRNA dimethylallyltransferase [Halotydeus destructor]|nr:tRNA dimethylallyltransferase [Halotydeus destructor]
MIRDPVVVVLGATGTGKSKLAIEIARKFNGEIISADSMQVYKNLDIVTAKVTPEEQSMAKHHLISFVDPLTRITAVDFRNRALDCISSIHKDKKLPIVVGGTNYYIETLLWNVLINPDAVDKNSFVFNEEDKVKKKLTEACTMTDSELNTENVFEIPILAESFPGVTSAHLHSLLSHLDPEGANQFHPNEKRKILRALQVLQKTGRKYSDFLKEQKISKFGLSQRIQLRYKNAIVLWLTADSEVLNQRLDARVDDMMTRGLLEELIDFHEKYNEARLEANASPSYTQGIFQCIGFKEFHDYLLLSPENRRMRTDLCDESVNEMKRVTRKYARKQNRWVMNKIVNSADRETPPVYQLDATDLSSWDHNVASIGFSILESLLNGEKTEAKPINLKAPEQPINEKKMYQCLECDRVFQGSFQWNAHLTSRSHKLKTKKRRMSELNMQSIEKAN